MMLKSSRRKFIASATSLAVATTVNGSEIIEMDEKYIAHQVYFWLKNPGSAEDRTQLINGIKTLRKIKSVQKITIGIVAATEKRPVIDDSWGVSELATFKDLAGQAAYQVDPIHLAFAKNYGHLWSRVLIYDSSEV
ncbi:MAG: Dabb family protein [Bacteroidota bacterium]